MTKKRLLAIIIGLAILLIAGVAAYAATANYGSRDDPLIAKSYLDEVVRPEIDAAVAEALEGVKASGGEFKLLTLQSGQTVTCAVGTELLPRFGSATAYAYDSADVALVDTTDALALTTGTELTANHLYMVTILGNGFTATADNTKILISGAYTIE